MQYFVIFTLTLNIKYCKEREPNIIFMNDPVCIFGDLHGHFYDLLNMFATIQGINHFK
jgi:hypothetical protein